MTIVRTTGGSVAGLEVDDGATGGAVRRFAGIPYAAPPVGSRRFAPPVRAPRWDDVRPAHAFGAAAPQRTSGPLVGAVPGMGVGATSEDCLTLNVWAPLDAGPTDDLPVLVWIHGGAFVIGSSSLATYDAAHLCAAEDVVVVSCNYRLGALGFLALPETANLALQDQQAALRWVRENIAAFGGDPAAITIFGESAGAGSILHLLGAPGSAGLFRRAILQSPGAETTGRPLAEELAGAFVRHLVGRPEEATVAQVLDAQEAAAEELAASFGSMPWSPVVDGEVVPAHPGERAAAGAVRDVDVLVGTTSEELKLFTATAAAWPPEVAAKVLRHLWTPVLGHDPGATACGELIAAYGEDGSPPVDVYTQALSDAAMGVPSVRLLDALSGHNPRTYAYRFDWRAPVHGACHACDLPFTFGTFDREGWGEWVGADDDAHRLSGDMIRAWADFARTGDPGWPAYDAEQRQTMILGRQSAVAEHPLAARLHLYDEGATT